MAPLQIGQQYVSRSGDVYLVLAYNPFKAGTEKEVVAVDRDGKLHTFTKVGAFDPYFKTEHDLTREYTEPVSLWRRLWTILGIKPSS